MPDRKGVYFDIYNDKDLIFIFEGVGKRIIKIIFPS